ncbi:cation:proton antiporter [Lactiplantibacillus fabifermentans]|uniref:Na(+) h(+) antiporter n=2 Tax=Lactiplantibacillus fabifermentans TaxID=483011 RepID=A0A0R2NTI1_9LACO|nr:cation:proton antiporter [Lactiplantibacillus fabifermentans]ETY72654.1 sodium:proton antiporter [Lactiplantibacillus fabifermentans T30PCM01]KRO28043.1 na(+) h(+) antiporter [Lactiplantibacillus fabifermentans DSM 21115]
MGLLISTAVLVVAAMVSIVINRRWLPRLSVNYVSMLIGALIAVVPLLNGLVEQFNSEVFIGLIVAPLLYFEGQNTRLNLVGRNVRGIISMTVGMVILCAVVAGLGTSWLAGLGLPLAFILAAISTPTDATATESVTMGRTLPARTATNLKLESLFNDASGIILLNMAILWYVNGYINYSQTLWDFIYSAGGGIIFGGVVSAVIVYLRQLMLRSKLNFINNTYNNGTPLKIIYLMTPFILYFGGEALGVSGIIAVVFAGLVHNAEGERSALANPQLASDIYQLISLLSDILNSVVFLVLGIMLVRTTLDKSVTTSSSWLWVTIGVILYLANLLARYGYVRLVHHIANREAWIFALGGIHGAVTFALAFTVAETQVKTADFNLVLMSESLLIILSLLVPTIIFRWLLPKVEDDTDAAKRMNQTRQRMIETGVAALWAMDTSEEFKKAVTFDLKSQNGHTTVRQFVKEWRRMVEHPEYTSAQIRELTVIYRGVFQAERDYLLQQYETEHVLNEDIFNILYREIAMAEMVVLDYGVGK